MSLMRQNGECPPRRKTILFTSRYPALEISRGLPGYKAALMRAVHSLSSRKSGSFNIVKANFIPSVSSAGKGVW